MSTESVVLLVPVTLVSRLRSSTGVTVGSSETLSSSSKRPTRRFQASWRALLARAVASVVAVAAAGQVAVVDEVLLLRAMFVAMAAAAKAPLPVMEVASEVATPPVGLAVDMVVAHQQLEVTGVDTGVAIAEEAMGTHPALEAALGGRSSHHPHACIVMNLGLLFISFSVGCYLALLASCISFIYWTRQIDTDVRKLLSYPNQHIDSVEFSCITASCARALAHTMFQGVGAVAST